MKPIQEFAHQLSNAYSTNRYKNGWTDCIQMLRTRGYRDQEIEAIIRSKWTRWAADMSGQESGEVESTALARFLDSERDPDKLSEEIQMLVENLYPTYFLN